MTITFSKESLIQLWNNLRIWFLMRHVLDNIRKHASVSSDVVSIVRRVMASKTSVNTPTKRSLSQAMSMASTKHFQLVSVGSVVLLKKKIFVWKKALCFVLRVRSRRSPRSLCSRRIYHNILMWWSFLLLVKEISLWSSSLFEEHGHLHDLKGNIVEGCARIQRIKDTIHLIDSNLVESAKKIQQLNNTFNSQTGQCLCSNFNSHFWSLKVFYAIHSR